MKAAYGVKLASKRALIELPDGRIGRLVFFAPKGGRHKVLIGGRYSMIDNDQKFELLTEPEESDEGE